MKIKDAYRLEQRVIDYVEKTNQKLNEFYKQYPDAEKFKVPEIDSSEVVECLLKSGHLIKGLDDLNAYHVAVAELENGFIEYWSGFCNTKDNQYVNIPKQKINEQLFELLQKFQDGLQWYIINAKETFEVISIPSFKTSEKQCREIISANYQYYSFDIHSAMPILS